MRFDAITVFPQAFASIKVSKIWRDAEATSKVTLMVHDLRDYATDKHRSVDDEPYGGGSGMVIRIEPLVAALEAIPRLPGGKVFFASPQGRKLEQGWLEQVLHSCPQLILVAGRYEGVDQRFIDGWVDQEFSIGDYVVSGGELPCMVLMDALTRLIPGVVGKSESVEKDSFTSGLLKYPQYTRPAQFRGIDVPDVLLSGNHASIEVWRQEQSRQRTLERRPEMLRSV